MRARSILYAGFLVLSVPLACSAGGAAGKVFPGVGNGGSGNGTGSSSGSGSTFGAGSTFGSGSVFGSGGSDSGAGGADSSACPRVVSQPEQIVKYQDATVTDTIITYSPIAIYIMQDRSSSMVGVLGDPSRWPNSETAITTFVNDPLSTGLYVGLGAFPPYPSNAANDCTNDCKTPVVPIATLPGNASSIANAYTTLTPPTFPPNFTPTECGLNGMVDACANFKAANPGIDCVALLITDGAPDACNTNTSTLTGIVSTAASQGIKTFVLALPGADLNFLNSMAVAGGTTSAIDATTGGSTAIVNALNTVRQKSAKQVTSQTTTQTVISTALPCEWTVSSTINPTKTNLEFTPDTSATPQVVEQFGHATDATACANVLGDAWYYDNNSAPTKVTVCPTTCDKIKAAPKPIVNLIFGCDTVDAPPR